MMPYLVEAINIATGRATYIEVKKNQVLVRNVRLSRNIEFCYFREFTLARLIV